jgi:hypothetical protein
MMIVLKIQIFKTLNRLLRISEIREVAVPHIIMMGITVISTPVTTAMDITTMA